MESGTDAGVPLCDTFGQSKTADRTDVREFTEQKLAAPPTFDTEMHVVCCDTQLGHRETRKRHRAVTKARPRPPRHACYPAARPDDVSNGLGARRRLSAGASQ